MRALAFVVLVPVVALADDDKKASPVIAPAELSRTEPIDYAKDVRPIFAAKCTVCHTGKDLDGDYDMGSHAGVLKGGKRGVAVVPGKPDESNLYLFSTHAQKPIMPPRSENNDLTSQEVAIVKRWIEEGAKGPTEPEVKQRATVVLNLPPAVFNPVRAVAISPDSATIAVGRGNQIHLFDAKSGEYRQTLTDPDLKTPDGQPAAAAHLSLVEAMAYSPDGQTLASGSFREVVLWDMAAGKPKARIDRFTHNVTCLAYSADGAYLAAGGGAPTEDGEILVFDGSGQPVLDLTGGHSDTVFGVSFSPDGKRLATAAADKFVKVFEVPSGKLLKSFEGHTHHVLDVGWTPDGTKLASAGADDVVKVWDYEKGEKIRDIRGYQKQVTRLVFVGKTPTFLTASGDANVRLLNAENGGQQRAFGGAKDFVYAVAASADGSLVAAGGEEGIVRLYNGQNGQLIKALLPPNAEKK
jgi:WD40 repeat protein